MGQGIDAGSFEFYEGIRIVIPGALAAALLAGLGLTFDFKAFDFTHETVAGLLVTVGLGLVLYFMDAPAKSAVFKPLQPTEKLASWGVKPRTSSVLNVYLLMLDTDIPAAIRARALYMGSMFRIGFESIYLLIAVSTGVLLTSPLRATAVTASIHLTAWRVFFLSMIAGAWVFALHREVRSVIRSRARKRRTVNGRTAASAKTAGSHDVAFVKRSIIDYVLMGAATIVFVVMFAIRSRVSAWPFAVPGAFVITLWAVRYFQGYRRDASATVRAPVDAVHAALLSAVGMILVLSAQLVVPSRLSRTEECFWSSAAFLAILLIVARGHERRLRGSYASQNAWLEENRDEVVGKYFTAGGPASVAESPPSEASTDWRFEVKVSRPSKLRKGAT